jgi:hypothetical protein
MEALHIYIYNLQIGIYPKQIVVALEEGGTS